MWVWVAAGFAGWLSLCVVAVALCAVAARADRAAFASSPPAADDAVQLGHVVQPGHVVPAVASSAGSAGERSDALVAHHRRSTDRPAPMARPVRIPRMTSRPAQPSVTAASRGHRVARAVPRPDAVSVATPDQVAAGA